MNGLSGHNRKPGSSTFSAELSSMGFPPLTSIKFQEKPPVLELPRNLWRYACKLAVGALSLMQNVGDVFAWTVAINTLSVSGRQNPGNWVLGKTEINMVEERSLCVTTVSLLCCQVGINWNVKVLVSGISVTKRVGFFSCLFFKIITHPLSTPNVINFNHAGVLPLSGCLRFYFFFSYFKTKGRKSGMDKETTSEGKAAA